MKWVTSLEDLGFIPVGRWFFSFRHHIQTDFLKVTKRLGAVL